MSLCITMYFVGARLNSMILANTLKIQGFMCYDHFSRWPQAHAVLNEWIDKVVRVQCLYTHKLAIYVPDIKNNVYKLYIFEVD